MSFVDIGLVRIANALSRVDSAVVPLISRLTARLRWRVGPWRWQPLNALAVLLVVGVGGIAVVTLVRPAPDPPGGGPPAWIGVHDGDSVPDYIAVSHARLAALVAGPSDRTVYALVSLSRYLAPQELAALIADTPAVLSVKAFARVPLVGRQTELVTLVASTLPADILTAMAGIANRKDADGGRYANMAATVPEGTLRQIYESNAEVSRQEAAAYRAGCACVVALVVRGSPADLNALASRPGVRAVDPAPEVSDPAGAVFSPPLPEQTDRVEPPADDALPT